MKSWNTLGVAAVLLMATNAYGGLASSLPVEVDLETNRALGDQVAARFSDNDAEFIGCGVRYFSDGDGGVNVFGFCQASDAAGTSLFCSTFDNSLVEAIQGLSSFSFITFTVNEDGECQSIGSSTQSIYVPASLAPPAPSDDDDDDD